MKAAAGLGQSLPKIAHYGKTGMEKPCISCIMEPESPGFLIVIGKVGDPLSCSQRQDRRNSRALFRERTSFGALGQS
jgi:hypothetical protein